MRILNVDLVICDRCGEQVHIRAGGHHDGQPYGTLVLRKNITERLSLSAWRGLSTREEEVMAWLSKGASNKEIARKLNCAEATIKVHVKAVLRKTATTNRTQAAVLATNGKDGKAPEHKNGAEQVMTPVELTVDLCPACVDGLHRFLRHPQLTATVSPAIGSNVNRTNEASS